MRSSSEWEPTGRERVPVASGDRRSGDTRRKRRCRAARAQQCTQHPRSNRVQRRSGMRVVVQRHRGPSMTEPGADRLHGGTRVEQRRRSEVPQIVKPGVAGNRDHVRGQRTGASAGTGRTAAHPSSRRRTRTDPDGERRPARSVHSRQLPTSRPARPVSWRRALLGGRGPSSSSSRLAAHWGRR
jgi:hypothetical protein